MFTLSSLPRHGDIRVFVTCEYVTPDSAAEGMAAESGWVDSLTSTDIQEARNYVTPFYEVSGYEFLSTGEAGTDARAELVTLIESLGAYESEDGSTLRAVDGVTWDYTQPGEYLYTLHAHVKHYTAENGWVETDLSIIPA